MSLDDEIERRAEQARRAMVLDPEETQATITPETPIGARLLKTSPLDYPMAWCELKRSP